jgi:hypothetical protein
VAEQVTEADLTAEAVADSTGGRYWSVDDCPWSSVCPSLPDELVELLAPPVLVGATPVGGHRRDPGEGRRDPMGEGRRDPMGGRRGGHGRRQPRR